MTGTTAINFESDGIDFVSMVVPMQDANSNTFFEVNFKPKDEEGHEYSSILVEQRNIKGKLFWSQHLNARGNASRNFLNAVGKAIEAHEV